MAKWKQKKTEYKNFEEEREALFGTKTPDEKESSDYKVKGLNEIINRVKEAVANKERIVVRTDYDVDGVMSAAEWTLILRDLNCEKYEMQLPHRISDGYGLKQHVVDKLLEGEPGLLILTDNGISAAKLVKQLIDNCWDVIILDHHDKPADGVLPDTMYLIDPVVIEEQADFKYYCGAGLVYKLACEMNLKETTMKKILSFAAIATVADCVEFVDEETHAYDNYLIVKNGLKSLLDKDGRTIGLYVLLRLIGADYNIDEYVLGFKLGPIINAAGRLYDDGPDKVYRLMVYEGSNFTMADDWAKELDEINNKRKEIQSEVLEMLKNNLPESTEYNVLPLYVPDIQEGLCGLISSDVTKTFKVASIVMTDCQGEHGEGKIKGSARTFGDLNIKKLLDMNNEHILEYGGHPGAAGLTVEKNKFDTFKKALEKTAGKYVTPEDVEYYDYEINEEDVPIAVGETDCFAPYGVGNPKPVFKVNMNLKNNKSGDFYSYLGATKQTLKLFGSELDAINFKGEGKEKFEKLGNPLKVSLIGTLGKNVYKGNTRNQLIFTDIKEREKK